MTSVLRLIALFTGLVFLTSTGTKAAPKAKPKTKPATHLTIDNQRSAVLVQLILIGKADKKRTPLVVAHGLEAGQKIEVPFPKAGCLYSINGMFDDEAAIQIDEFDLCKDHTLKLVEDSSDQ